MGWYLYLVGTVFLILAVIFGAARRRNSLRSGDISGAVFIGDVAGTVTQTVSPAGSSKRASVEPDRVAWGIGIVGVLIAVVQLIHDLLK